MVVFQLVVLMITLNISSLDPTGSYLTTYVTSIGLYNDNELLVVAKKYQRIGKKITGGLSINFLIKIDL